MRLGSPEQHGGFDERIPSNYLFCAIEKSGRLQEKKKWCTYWPRVGFLAILGGIIVQ
jgi:hypothetical protein